MLPKQLLICIVISKGDLVYLIPIARTGSTVWRSFRTGRGKRYSILVYVIDLGVNQRDSYQTCYKEKWHLLKRFFFSRRKKHDYVMVRVTKSPVIPGGARLTITPRYSYPNYLPGAWRHSGLSTLGSFPFSVVIIFHWEFQH